MGITLPLEKMSTEEKMQTMEAIWDSLCQKADSLKSPEWHREILKEREERVRKGEEKFVDWNQAKKDIRNSL